MFPVEVGTMRHMVSVRQRPHLHTFLERVSQLYEVRLRCCGCAWGRRIFKLGPA